MAQPLHIAHIVFRLDFGGLENGLVNLINRLPADGYRHSIVALTEATEFARRIERLDVEVLQLHKRPGKDFGAYRRLYKLLCKLRPDIVHTRNLGTLDCQAVARAAGVPVRIHGEHGWDVADPDGLNSKNLLLRRLLAPLVHRWIALSGEIEAWLTSFVGVPSARIRRICNGVDTEQYLPRSSSRGETLELGSVTRFSEIKDPLNTIEAFIKLKESGSVGARLTMVGDGPLRPAATRCRVARARGRAATGRAFSKQLDVVPWLHEFDVFVLGSLREGISNTVLEAMACGLPVIATDTGGNPELVDAGVTGTLMPPANSNALAAAMEVCAQDPGRILCHGAAARLRAEERFSITAMVSSYDALYIERPSTFYDQAATR